LAVPAALILVVGALSPLHGRAGTDDPVEVPLAVRDGRMVVPVRTPDGAELSFLVSTGSAVTVLSESGAARAAGRDLTLGGVPLDMEGVRTVEDGSLTVDGTVMDGLVGVNTLNRFDVLFDAPGGRLVLQPVGPAVAWPIAGLSEPVRLRVYHGVVLGLDVEVNGVEYPAMLELGSPALLVNQRVLEEAGIDGETVDRMRLGSSTFHDVPVRLSDHPVIARFSPGGDGFVLVGTPPALACPVAISWVHREMRTCAR
jgi:hypothetical protein